MGRRDWAQEASKERWAGTWGTFQPLVRSWDVILILLAVGSRLEVLSKGTVSE